MVHYRCDYGNIRITLFLAVADGGKHSSGLRKTSCFTRISVKLCNDWKMNCLVTLVFKRGRNIRLTDHGRLLQRKLLKLFTWRALDLALGGHHGHIQVVMAGPDVLLSEMGLLSVCKSKRNFQKAVLNITSADDDAAIAQVVRGEGPSCHHVTTEVPSHLGLSTKILAETTPNLCRQGH